ncbi:hypothetical protein BH09MYX1_BH09MYX1_32730 [soil metagenome]
MRLTGVASSLALAFAGVFVAGPALAQAKPEAPDAIAVGDFQFRPTFSVRTRAEYRHAPTDLGGLTPSGPADVVDDAWGIMERARLGLGVERGPVRGQITLQDARVWGQTPPTGIASTPSAFASTGAFESWLEMRTSNATPSYLRIGRQTIEWNRFLGQADASPVGRSFDAVRGHAAYKTFELEAVAAFVDPSRPVGTGFGDVSGPYRGGAQLLALQAKWTPDPLFSVELDGYARPAMGLAQPAASRFAQSRAFGDLYSGALRIAGEGKGWKYEVIGALQFGTIDFTSAFSKNRFAYAVAGDVQKTFDGIVWSPTLRLGGAYASGGEDDTGYHQFDPLFPDVHGPQGLMNSFAWSNIIEGHANLSVKPSADVTMGLEYRYVRLADITGDWLDGYLISSGRVANATDAELGQEIDFTLNWRPWPALDLAGGYSLLVLGRGAKEIALAQGRVSREADGSITISPLAHYAFLQATLRIP